MAGWTGVDLIGSIAGVLTTLAFVPQVARTWRTRSARDLSLAWLVVFIAGVALWLVYGLVLASWPLIMANGVTLALVLMLLWMKLATYRGRNLSANR